MSNEITARNLLLALAISLMSATFVIGALPAPGTQAIGIVTHPNDIFAEIYQDASPPVVAISGMNDLITYLARYTQPSQEVMLTILRDGEAELQTPITLGAR